MAAVHDQHGSEANGAGRRTEAIGSGGMRCRKLDRWVHARPAGVARITKRRHTCRLHLPTHEGSLPAWAETQHCGSVELAEV